MGKLRLASGRLGVSSSTRLTQPQDTRSSKETEPFYLSKEWKSFRNQLIKERGWRCQDPKCETPQGPWKQIYGHHLVEIKDGGATFDRGNVMLVCGRCHGRVTIANRAKRAGLLDVV